MSTFLIASLKHTGKDDEYITWWKASHKGYTPVVGEFVGRYCYGEACSLNDGVDYIAVPAEAVERLLSPEPYFANRTGTHRWYDQPGPVVANTRANWNALFAASLVDGRHVQKIKPEVYRGKRRSFALEGSVPA